MGNAVMRWQIITKNPDRLVDFYSKLFGWEINANNALGYRTVDTGTERGINGGIWPAPPQAPNFVQLFIEVDDIHDAVENAKKFGANVLISPQQLPDGEVLSILHDPEGVSFGLYQPAAE